ncbi:MAG: YitT family protein [Bacillota bacterium]|nr:YitT family protein [Bacillota bacterium]
MKYRGYRERKPWETITLISLGTMFMAVGMANIYDPYRMVTGGVGGIAIILRAILGVPLWVSNAVINIPLFLGGYAVKGWKFLVKTVYATVLLTIVLMFLPQVNLIPGNDLFLAAIFGGLLNGIGCGLVFACKATSGGTDLLAAIIQHFLPHYSITQMLQFVDWCIIIVGIHFFGIELALYAVISIYVMNRVCSMILDGMHFAKTAFIISDRASEIAASIMQELGRGVTGIQAFGMFTGKEGKMLYSVISNREVPLLKDIVWRIDPSAFVIVSDAKEVLGEGFSREIARS